MGNAKLLLMDDSEDTRDLVYSALGSNSSVLWASSVAEAKQNLDRDFHLILLDVELPDGDGFAFYHHLRANVRHRDTPVIFLTGRDSVQDKVRGISMGADDYITKPFSAADLKARVQMRIEKEALRASVVKKEDLHLHLAEQRATWMTAGQTTDLLLTTLEFRLLTLLATHEGETFSRAEILHKVWGEGISLTDRCVDTHIYSLRKKLGKRAAWIHSVYRKGYCFTY